MATTKQEMPEQKGQPPRENAIIEPHNGDTLNSVEMWACGTYDSPRFMNVTAAVWKFDYSATVSSTSGGNGGAEIGTVLFPVNMWRVQFDHLVATPNPAQPYHLVVRYWKTGGG